MDKTEIHDILNGRFAKHSVDADGNEELRIYRKTQYSPNESEIKLNNDQVKKLRHLFFNKMS